MREPLAEKETDPTGLDQSLKGASIIRILTNPIFCGWLDARPNNVAYVTLYPTPCFYFPVCPPNRSKLLWISETNLYCCFVKSKILLIRLYDLFVRQASKHSIYSHLYFLVELISRTFSKLGWTLSLLITGLLFFKCCFSATELLFLVDSFCSHTS